MEPSWLNSVGEYEEVAYPNLPAGTAKSEPGIHSAHFPTCTMLHTGGNSPPSDRIGISAVKYLGSAHELAFCRNSGDEHLFLEK
ncbi:hypothetical protein N7453_006364 [Penicillium expansum]|nr:hypothetical protein N7453_006364 [Penicillium expansum]